MSNDTIKWLVGAAITIVLSVVGTSVALGIMITSQIGNVQTAVDGRVDDLQDVVNERVGDLRDVLDSRIGDVQNAIGELRTDVRGYDDRLRSVEVRVAQVDQRLSGVSPQRAPVIVGDPQQMLEELQTAAAQAGADDPALSENLEQIIRSFAVVTR